MSGSEALVADTSIIIAFLKGDPQAGGSLLGSLVRVSVITEMELLSYHKLRPEDLIRTSAWLRRLEIIGLSNEVKAIAIRLQRERLFKLPDSIIAATAIALGMPLVTGDQRFRKVKDRLDVRELKLSR
jgi:predicted nucleic acid-binding protein